MSLCDDKRFILSHIRHSFITCDDTGMCESVMLNESLNRYPYESLYCNNIYDDFDDDVDDVDIDDQQNFNNLINNEIELLKKTELEYRSELNDDDQPTQSLDIMNNESYEMGIRRRSNTAQKLEKLRNERKVQSKTKVIKWKGTTPIVWKNNDNETINIKRIVLDAQQLLPQERDLLEFDQNENVYYETDAYRKLLFPKKEIESNNEKIVNDNDNDNDNNDNDNDNNNNNDNNDENKTRKKSMLSQLVEKLSESPINPFNKFTIFDGRLSDNQTQTKRIRIFFNILENNPEFVPYDFSEKFTPSKSDINCGRNWIEVVALANARVCDLIGLICWHYTRLQIGPPLKPDLLAYALKIAEENGFVDNDLPSLGFNDEIKRYGFPYLSLVSVETEIIVTVFISSEDVFSQFKFDTPSTKLIEIVEQMKKKRSHLFRNRTTDFSLELKSNPGVSLDLNSSILQYLDKFINLDTKKPTIKFVLKFPENKNKFDNNNKLTDMTISAKEKSLSLPKGITGIRLNKSSSALYSMDHSNNIISKFKKDPKDYGSIFLDIMEAPLYQCFDVNAITKFSNSPVKMAISETKVEITPKMNSRSPSVLLSDKLFSFLNGIKAMNINIENVVECIAIPIKKSVPQKQIFKIIYWNDNEFKSIKFEADTNIVDNIVFKVQNIMKLRTSLRRKEFNMMKNQKKKLSSKINFKTRISSTSSESGNEDIIDIDKEFGGNSIPDEIINSKNNYDLFRNKKFRKFRSKNVD